MAEAGTTIEDPVTKQRITFVRTAKDTNGDLLLVDVTMFPGAFMFRHLHPKQEEHIEVTTGALTIAVRGKAHVLSAGETYTVSPRVPHELRNATDRDCRFLLEVRPALRTEFGMETLFRLAQEGKTTRRGLPRNPFQMAVIAHAHLDEAALAGIPLVLQRASIAPLAFVGRLLGYKE